MTEQASKVALSPFEQELVSDVEWIYAKNSILQKTAVLMGNVANQLQAEYALPAIGVYHGFRQSPKISRGEVYEDLPWIMLDYPREFQREDWLAVRHFFSWGRGFTVSLLLHGMYMDRALNGWEPHWLAWQKADFAQVVTDDPWKHHGDPAIQRSLNELSPEESAALARERGFLQIRKHLPVENWAGADSFMLETHRAFIPLIRECSRLVS